MVLLHHVSIVFSVVLGLFLLLQIHYTYFGFCEYSMLIPAFVCDVFLR